MHAACTFVHEPLSAIPHYLPGRQSCDGNQLAEALAQHRRNERVKCRLIYNGDHEFDGRQSVICPIHTQTS
jgi:hypothetical protein